MLSANFATLPDQDVTRFVPFYRLRCLKLFFGLGGQEERRSEPGSHPVCHESACAGRSRRFSRRVAIQSEVFAPIIRRLGVRNSVSTVANARPPATDDDNCVQYCVDGAPTDTLRLIRSISTAKTMGISPRIVVTVVNSTGRRRTAQVLRIASNASEPRLRKTL